MLSLLSQHSVFFPFMLVFLRFLSLFLCKDKDLLILDDLSRNLDWNLRIHRPHIHSNCLLFATLIKSPDMGSNLNSVHYCCVSRDSQILYAYNNARNQRNESLAALCLEKTPPFHKWYFETMSKKTFGFLMGDGFVYFVIVDDVFRRSSVLDFLENLRDEFKKANKKHLRGSLSGSNVEDQLVRRLIASLEADLTCLPISSPSIDGAEQKSDTATSTKAPLLGRSNKQGKKKGRDHVNSLRGIEIEENRKSNDRGNVTEWSDSSSAAATTHVPRRRRSTGSQNIERKWQRQVQIILAIDAAICLLLLGVWLAICQGIECTRS